MRILILGDVVGRPGRRAVRELVPALVKQEQIDLAIANAENAAGGMGVDIKSAGELFSARVFTSSPAGITFGKKKRSILTWRIIPTWFDPPISRKARPDGGGVSGKAETGSGSNH